MISQKMKASARILGVGLLALAVTAPAALAQAKKAQCPMFTSKDVDAWYKAAGFDTGADDAAPAPGADRQLTCALEFAPTTEASPSYATLVELEQALGQKTVDGNNVDGVVNRKYIHVGLSIQGDGSNPYVSPYQYDLEVRADGTRLAGPVSDRVLITPAEYKACVNALIGSMAWNRWACRNK